MTCRACKRGDGPMSLHHWDDGGCRGTFYGASFTIEGTGPPWTIRRIEPDTQPSAARPCEDRG